MERTTNRWIMIELRCWKLVFLTMVVAGLITLDGDELVHATLPTEFEQRPPPPLRNLRQSKSSIEKYQQRHTATTEYFRTEDRAILGTPNYRAAIGNPLKGLVGFGPREFLQQTLPDNVPSAIEKYNLGLNEIMIGDNQFNWTSHDQLVAASASRNMHAVFSIFIHWPGQQLRLPPHLLNQPLVDTSYGKSPNYGDAKLLLALKQFIFAWGRHIDGDTRIAAVHVGLLGFWGEGHTYPDTILVPETTSESVANWYRSAFTKTQVQARYPDRKAHV